MKGLQVVPSLAIMHHILYERAGQNVHSLAEGLVFLWLSMAVVLLGYVSASRRRERQLMMALRNGRTYARLYNKLEYLLRHYDIDQVIIEQHGVTVTSVYPAHTLLSFEFKQNGNSKRCDAVARLVAQLLREDFPLLGAGDIYKMSRYRVYRANGRRDDSFSFTMRRCHKDQVMDRHSTVQLRIL